jgi:OmpA-OmpF porin, OOP family
MFLGVGRCKSRASLVSILVAVVLLLPAIAMAQPEAAGAKDFPLIKRYEGSRLIGYDSRAFDTFKVLLGKLKVNDQGQTEVMA